MIQENKHQIKLLNVFTLKKIINYQQHNDN